MAYRYDTFDVAVLEMLDACYGPGQGRLLVIALLQGADLHAEWAILEALDGTIKQNTGTLADATATYVLRMDLGDGVWWNGHDLTIAGGLPETVLLEVPGRPLGSIVEHPGVPFDLIVKSVSTSFDGVTLHTSPFRRVGLEDLRRGGPGGLIDWIRIVAARARFNVAHDINAGLSWRNLAMAALGGSLGFFISVSLAFLTSVAFALTGLDPDLAGPTLAWSIMTATVGMALTGFVFQWLCCDMDGYDRICAAQLRRFGTQVL